MLVMAIRERVSSSSSSSFSSAEVSLKYTSVLKNSSGVGGVDVAVDVLVCWCVGVFVC